MHQVLAGLPQEASACLAASDVHTVASERCAVLPAAAWFASPRPAVEQTLTKKTPSPSTRRTSLRTILGKRRSVMGTRWKKVLCIPRLKAMSVHTEHRIFQRRLDCWRNLPVNPSLFRAPDSSGSRESFRRRTSSIEWTLSNDLIGSRVNEVIPDSRHDESL